MKACVFLVVVLLCSSFLCAQEKDISVHDPVMIRQNGTFYLFCTGRGISVWSSQDMKTWTRQKPVFDKAPEWAVKAVPGFKNHIWAPDISFFRGRYYLFYSVSAFGKNTSCIGLAVNRTLDESSPDFKWEDQGKIIQSYPGLTNWNAIDPNLVMGRSGQPYLAFGSFWDGLKFIKLRDDGMAVAGDTINLRTIASRKADPSQKQNPPAVEGNPPDAGGNAIEAPFIFKKGHWYYLFASIDYCCKGVNSTYKMIIGRSANPEGPYVDMQGRRLDSGGGSILLAGDGRWHGLGHNAVCSFDGKDYLVYHAYDARNNGVPKLQIRRLDWTCEEWPKVVEHEIE